MKKILVITYYWPPSGGAAVQRWLSFANYLAEAGVDVHLLTVEPSQATFQLLDESLVKHIHSSIKVHTTATREPFKVFTLLFGKKSLPKPAFSNEGKLTLKKKVARFIRGNFFIPDPRKGWKPFAIEKASALIRQENIRCVITAGPPHSTHLIGAALKRNLSVSWIADFHDLWTDVIYYDMLYHLPLVKRLDRKLERAVLEGADFVLTVGDKYKQKLLSKSPKISDSKIQVLRIGYDEHFFSAASYSKQENFTITYTGTLASFYAPEVFISALAEVRKRFPAVPFKLCFAGVLPQEIKAAINAAGLGEVLQDFGYVAHRRAVELMQTTTALLLVNPVTKDEEMVIPGKVYEYLAAKKPIINITTLSAETAVLIQSCSAGRTFSRDQQTELENYLGQLVTKWQTFGTVDIDGSESCVSNYSRATIAKELLSLLEERM